MCVGRCLCVCVYVCAGVHHVFQISQLLFTHFRECTFTWMFNIIFCVCARIHSNRACIIFVCASLSVLVHVRVRVRVRERVRPCDSYLIAVGFSL